VTKKDVSNQKRKGAADAIHATTKAVTNHALLKAVAAAAARNAMTKEDMNPAMTAAVKEEVKEAQDAHLNTDKTTEVIALIAICPHEMKKAASQATAADIKMKSTIPTTIATKTLTKNTDLQEVKAAGDSLVTKKAASKAVAAVTKTKNMTAITTAMKMTISTTKAAASAAAKSVAAAGHKAAEVILLTVTDVKKLLREN
jgi:hypothetical protein